MVMVEDVDDEDGFDFYFKTRKAIREELVLHAMVGHMIPA